MSSSTRGLGDVVRAALEDGVAELVICLGGSASTDGGAGLLCALGAILRDARGHTVEPSGAGLAAVAELDLTDLDHRLPAIEVIAATDVRNPLLGAEGAAAVFAPQKGADPDQVTALEAGLRRWAEVLARATGVDAANTPGAGAAGGTGAAAIAALGAHVVSGADYVQSALGITDAIDWADLVLTGAGALDRQSLMGKGTVALARRAQARGVPVAVTCGRIDLTAAELRDCGIDFARTLVELARDGQDAMAAGPVLLRQAARLVTASWALPAR